MHRMSRSLEPPPFRHVFYRPIGLELGLSKKAAFTVRAARLVLDCRIMRKRTLALFVAAAVSCCVLTSATHARAQDTTVIVTGQAPPPPLPPGYAPVAPPANTTGSASGYPTPIYSQTPPVYDPQRVAPSGPAVIHDWSAGEPIPPGYHPRTRVRGGLVAGGAVLFGITYLVSVLVASVGSDSNPGQSNPVAALLVPAAGPFIQMGHGGNTAVANYFLALDGLSQVGGMTMFALGFADPQTVLVRDPLASGTPRLAITPILGPDRGALGLVGTF